MENQTYMEDADGRIIVDGYAPVTKWVPGMSLSQLDQANFGGAEGPSPEAQHQREIALANLSIIGRGLGLTGTDEDVAASLQTVDTGISRNMLDPSKVSNGYTASSNVNWDAFPNDGGGPFDLLAGGIKDIAKEGMEFISEAPPIIKLAMLAAGGYGAYASLAGAGAGGGSILNAGGSLLGDGAIPSLSTYGAGGLAGTGTTSLSTYGAGGLSGALAGTGGSALGSLAGAGGLAGSALAGTWGAGLAGAGGAGAGGAGTGAATAGAGAGAGAGGAGGTVSAGGGLIGKDLLGTGAGGLLGTGLTGGQVAGMLGGGLLGGIGGSKESGKITTTTEPWSEQKPYLTDLFGRAKTAMDNSGGPSHGEISAVNSMYETAIGQNGNPMLGMDNPYLSKTIQTAQDDVTRNMQGQFNTASRQSGSYGNSGLNSEFAREMPRALGNIDTTMRMQDYTNQQGLYENAANRKLSASKDLYTMAKDHRNTPFNNLEKYGRLIQGSYGGSSSQPYFTNPTSDILGGAMAGYNLFTGGK
jgi:hypothetical protein